MAANTGAAALNFRGFDIVLIDESASPFNPSNVLDVGSRFALNGASKNGKYKKQNDYLGYDPSLKGAVKDDDIGRIGRRLGRHITPVKGIAGASVVNDLYEARENGMLTPDTRVAIMHGQNRVSPVRDNRQTAAFLMDRLGIPTIEIEYEKGKHAVQNSFPAFASRVVQGAHYASQL